MTNPKSLFNPLQSRASWFPWNDSSTMLHAPTRTDASPAHHGIDHRHAAFVSATGGAGRNPRASSRRAPRACGANARTRPHAPIRARTVVLSRLWLRLSRPASPYLSQPLSSVPSRRHHPAAIRHSGASKQVKLALHPLGDTLERVYRALGVTAPVRHCRSGHPSHFSEQWYPAKEVRPDARPQAKENRGRIGNPSLFAIQRVVNALRIFSGRERRRRPQIIRRSRRVNVGQAPGRTSRRFS